MSAELSLALCQMNASDDPGENTAVISDMVQQAACAGAQLIATPEATNCVSSSFAQQKKVLQPQDKDNTLIALRTLAARYRVWVLIGSLAVQASKLTIGDGGQSFVNRSFLLTPNGNIGGYYDKIHMFDVNLGLGEVYHESRHYQAGSTAVVVPIDRATIGMTICYDLRFSYLYRALAQAGATIISVPAAFSATTGQAHWYPLLRARAIETGAYIIAPAQCGLHRATNATPRTTYGHSLVVSPWGEIIADGGEVAGIVYARLALDAVWRARKKIPAFAQDEPFTLHTVDKSIG